MKRIGSVMLVGATLTLLSGCGSFSNLAGYDHCVLMTLEKPSRPPVPFGGIANDGRMLANAVQTAGSNENALLVGAFGLADLPLSFAADVVTLPWTTYEFLREMHHPTDRYREKLTTNVEPTDATPTRPTPTAR